MSYLRRFILPGWLTILAMGCTDKQHQEAQTHASEAIIKMPVQTARLLLFSLDPRPGRTGPGKMSGSPETTFHGFSILGSSEIHSHDALTLWNAFAKGVHKSDGDVAACFNPRHGIRFIGASGTNDFVICFECSSVEAYNFGIWSNFSVTASPEPVFDQFLKKYKLPKAK